ncbi:MAG TPA: lipid A deacylase LpxR family protein [Cellvibrio sp.]|nr:lipid A deacylase LpxR family protein [Cellvibrio sp.]
MNISIDSIQDVTLPQGALLARGLEETESPSVKVTLRPTTAVAMLQRVESPASVQWLQPILLQIFALSLLIGCANFAQAGQYFLGAEDLPLRQQLSSEAALPLASFVEDEKRPTLISENRKIKSSWAFAFDNDLLAPGHRDRDYTYGMSLTYAGADATNAAISLKAPLAFIDRVLRIENLPATSQNNYSVEAGLYGFTPQDIELQQLDRSDRPYASLVYLSSSHEQVDAENNTAWKTTLTLGALGLGIVGDLQNSAHQQISGKEARGWNTQISEGGELTGRYVIARQQYLGRFADSLELKSTLQASLGYLTETSWSLSFRNGKITSPWASFNPDLISYGEKSTYSNSVQSSNEHYFWAGASVKARFYNAFLQGQVRDSKLSYDYDDLRPIIVEGWAGYTYAFRQGYRVSYVLRAQTSEIKQGSGDRSVVWGGLIFAKTI